MPIQAIRDMLKALSSLQEKKIIITDNNNILSFQEGNYHLRKKLHEYFRMSQLDIARIEAYLNPNEQIRGKLNVKAIQLRDKSVYYGFARLAIACDRFLRANETSNGFLSFLPVKEEFQVLVQHFLPLPGPIQNLHKMISRAAAKIETWAYRIHHFGRQSNQPALSPCSSSSSNLFCFTLEKICCCVIL